MQNPFYHGRKHIRRFRDQDLDIFGGRRIQSTPRSRIDTEKRQEAPAAGYSACQTLQGREGRGLQSPIFEVLTLTCSPRAGASSILKEDNLVTSSQGGRRHNAVK